MHIDELANLEYDTVTLSSSNPKETECTEHWQSRRQTSWSLVPLLDRRLGSHVTKSSMIGRWYTSK